MTNRLLGDKIARVFISGGAGFIGSHVTDALLGQGYKVTVYDNLSNGRREFIEQHFGKPAFNFVEADILDTDRLASQIEGHDLVWHLAANTDIIGGVEKPSRDLRDCVMGTFNVLEAMRHNRRPADHFLVDWSCLWRTLPRYRNLRGKRTTPTCLDLCGRQDRE